MLPCNQSRFFHENNFFDNENTVEMSTGQGKLSLLLPIILYKKHCSPNTPVILILDETLANIDHETTEILCNLIEKHFSNSFIIAVDHNYKSNEFYTDFINLSDFAISEDSQMADTNIFDIDLVGAIEE